MATDILSPLGLSDRASQGSVARRDLSTSLAQRSSHPPRRFCENWALPPIPVENSPSVQQPARSW
jgi:hypothetical protein